MKTITLSSSLKIFLVFTLFFSNLVKSDDSKIIHCKSGAAASDDDFCPTQMSCPEGYILSNHYTCSLDRDFTPSSKCETNKECWTGDCVDQETDLLTSCPSQVSCPPDYSRCPDNSCVKSVSECPEYKDCPKFLPIRCPNGDCRKSLDDCPSLVHCPDDFKILCNDGSCRSAKIQCVTSNEETTCDDKSLIRCSDGTCTNSQFLCPTMMTCPVGYEKCWDGMCALKGKCFDTKRLNKKRESERNKFNACESNNQILCQFDFSCATEIDSCPTGIICPIDKPIKCWDNSCRDSIENCPDYQECPSGLFECPDGSCGVKCGTHIKCSDDAPYRCYDNTCRRNPEDCPSQPSCPEETPILCWDGRCLAERGECLSPEQCDAISPVRCPNGLCAKSASNCKEEIDCPSEFTKCRDGSCRKKLADCPAEECPVNLPYKCNNGLCMSDSKYCDNDNGCPYYLPIKCSDGSCAENESNCPEKPTCPSGKKLCPDGSCLGQNVVCPSVMGCPIDTPYRCANGECINPKKSTCAIPYCDSSIPIKCYDGTCVLTVNYCPIERKISNSGNVICADGFEAPSYDECKPLVTCVEGEVRCNDGSCRQSKDQCPLAKTCPSGEERCENGSCAEKNETAKIDKCPAANGCPLMMPYKCPSNGLCVTDLDYCDTEGEEYESNGCPIERPLKCLKTSSCVANKEDCKEVEVNCPPEQIMCPDGNCYQKYVDCEEETKEKNFCEEESGKPIACESKYNYCAKTLGECYNSIECKIDSPFRCPNGDCKRYPSKISGKNGCEIGISCPNYKPYLCADGSCEEKSSFCKSYSACSEDKPYLCQDKTCAATKSECENNHEKCPSRNPILCENSNCVSSIYDCNESKCPSWTPYYCIMGNCKNTPWDCQKIKQEYVHNETKIIRIDHVLATVCKDNEFICIDGTCRENAEDCPLYAGCVNSNAPYKCLNGGCAANIESCEKKNNISEFICPEDNELCEDGVCRKNCSLVEYHGCPNDHPLLCPNGRCVMKAIECVGESACDSAEKPFRCVDGTCASSVTECKVAYREVGNTNIKLSIFPKMEISSDVIIGPGNIVSGSISIPAETIKKTSDGSSAETMVSLRSVPRSKINDTFTTYNQTRVDDLKLVYPYADESNKLTLSYQYTVLSTVVEIKLLDPENTKINGKILLTLLFDFPSKHPKLESSETTKKNNNDEEEEEYSDKPRYTMLPLHYSRDVCLGKLNTETRKWECNGLNYNVEEKKYLQLTGELNEEGIYAVIMHLKINDNKLYINENWIIANLKLLAIILVILIVIISLVIYVFLRIYRYRMKYKGTKDVYKGYELELSDLQDKSIEGRQGQTLADMKEGIIYTDNIAFKSQIDNEARKKNTQLEKIFDGYTKKLRLLERNNALLKGQYESMKSEYNRLNEYKESLKEGDKVKINVNVKNLNEENK